MGFIRTGSLLGHHTSSAPQVIENLSPQVLQSTPIVFVIDPDSAVHEALGLLISCQGWSPKPFRSAEDFLACPLELIPSCLLLEVALPGLSGLELQKRVARDRPHIPIIFLSANGDIPTTVEAMKAGAVDFLAKPFHEGEFLNAVREALNQSRQALVKEREKRALRKCYASLTSREREVMALVSYGLLNKQVGDELGISEITVKAHRGQVMRKMQAASLANLVKMAGRLGLAKGREATMFREHADRAAYVGGQLVGSPAFTP